MNQRAPAYCEATLNYSQGMDHRPVTVTIRDGRAALAELPFVRSGFTLLEHHSAVADWGDEAHLLEVHVPEIEALALEYSGCERAIVYPPLVRSPSTARQTEDYAPVDFVHSDFTEDYARMVREPERSYRAFLDPLLERAGLTRESVVAAGRILMLQFWRSTGPERPDFPLALCDARTVSRSQLEVFTVPEYGGQRLEFETFGVLPPTNPDEHHWYTFPGMTIDEVIALRTYDSQCEDQGRPFWTPHTAFRDPHAGVDAPPRESVEMRALCLFDL